MTSETASGSSSSVLQVADNNRVRTLALDRPEVLNAFNEALYDSMSEALLAAAADPAVAVVLVTGNGRAFSAGQDLMEMHARITDPGFTVGQHSFAGLIDTLHSFPKPLLCAVNGMGIGFGATLLGYADLVFMSSTARLKYPFTSLGVAPEAASSYLLPRLVGRQNAAWLLMSSEWIDAQEALRMGLVWKVCRPSELLAETQRYAEVLASQPISSLIAVKRTMNAFNASSVNGALACEIEQFKQLMGGPANTTALHSFFAGRA
ncbi:enoyl-CoA hydratase/isomerase family protein [Mycobacterium colombiense]